MSRLAVLVLGPPQIELDGVSIRLDRRKAIALLVYLAVTGERHQRDSLVNLLWPEYDSPRGRAALRRTLYALRKELEGAWLDVDREEIALRPDAEIWVDAVEFQRHLDACEGHRHPASQVCPDCVPLLSEAVALVRGELLSGFSLKDSFNFDDWQRLQAEALRRELDGALERLVHWHSGQREFEAATAYARRRLSLDPLDEGAHRQLMQLYAWSGRRPAALRQYEECVAVLQDQLGVPPQDPTTALYQAIQTGHIPPPPTTEPLQPMVGATEQDRQLPPGGVPDLIMQPPSFLEGEVSVERPVFVARERELSQLEGHLKAALAGQGKVVFVTGDAGSGKTALIQAFGGQAQADHGDLIVAGGHGNAHTGVGDPYLPFREILGLLTGDVEAQWAAGAMTKEQARRLWQILPLSVQALVRAGPDLVGLLVPGPVLVARAATFQPGPGKPIWFTQLGNLVAGKAADPTMPGLLQSALFEQYTQVLRMLASQRPLLLALDDLQWADSGSVSLLFHLGRRIAGSRILIVGAYRPAEVALGYPGSPLVAELAERGIPEGGPAGSHRERHPLQPVVNEFKRIFGNIEVDLDKAEGRQLVDALLDSEPNRMGHGFREALHLHTQGHPLFTVELLRGMQERGDLAQDQEGMWAEGPTLDWETLPARVEAVVAERIDRLPLGLRDLLSVASVEGETFTAEVVARVQDAGEREVVQHLSATLDRKHRLVSARGIQQMGSQRLSQYRFRHILYQKYLYHSLDAVEQVHLHQAVGTALETLYSAATQETSRVAPQLARHFEEAGIVQKAIHYLRQAGERAVQLSAYEEAIAHLTRGLRLLLALPDSHDAAQRMACAEQELALQLSLGMAWQGSKGTPSVEFQQVYARARELCQETGNTSQLCRVLGQLSLYHYVQAEHQQARELAEEALAAAQRAGDPLLIALGHWQSGVYLFCLGEYATARTHLEQVTSFYEPQQHHRAFVSLRGSDAGPSALAYDACCLWCLGYPDAALKLSQEALAMARALDHPFSLADVLCYAGCMFQAMRRDALALKDSAEALMCVSQVPRAWAAQGVWFRGEALAMLGQVQEGIKQMREGMAVARSLGSRLYLSGTLRSLAEAQARTGRPEEALSTLAEALDLVVQTDERHWEAELYRQQAEVMLMQGDDDGAEASFHKAIDVARRQAARSWELRATTGLASLWQQQGKVDQAKQVLAEIYGWFTEGHETRDLTKARRLLEDLSHDSPAPISS